MATGTVSLPRDAQVAALLNLPEIRQLITDLDETRRTGRPGYPIRIMIGVVLVRETPRRALCGMSLPPSRQSPEGLLLYFTAVRATKMAGHKIATGL